METETTAPRLIRLRDVMRMTGLGRSSVYANVKAGEFPAPIKLSARSAAWVQQEVFDWIDAGTVRRPVDRFGPCEVSSKFRVYKFLVFSKILPHNFNHSIADYSNRDS